MYILMYMPIREDKFLGPHDIDYAEFFGYAYKLKSTQRHISALVIIVTYQKGSKITV